VVKVKLANGQIINAQTYLKDIRTTIHKIYDSKMLSDEQLENLKDSSDNHLHQIRKICQKESIIDREIINLITPIR
jgi:hypothetical protein